MQRRRLVSITLASLALSPAFACSDDGSNDDEVGDTTAGDGDGDTTTAGDGDGDTTTAGDGDGDTTTAGDGDGDLTCTTMPGDHAAATCTGGECPIVTDVLLACNDSEFSDPGLRVAATAEQAWLVTASSNTAILLEASGDQGSTSDLPASMIRTTALLAQDQDGAVVLATDTTVFEGYAGGLTYYRRDQGAWVEELVFDLPDKYVRNYDLELAADGTAHLWFEDDPPESFEHATRQGPDSWTHEDSVPGNPGSWTRWTLDLAGVPIGFSFAGDFGGWQLETRIAGVDAPIGSPLADFAPLAYRPVSPAVPATLAPVPSFAVVVQHEDSLRVAWPNEGLGPEAWFEFALPETPLAAFNCSPGDPYVDCGPDCHEQTLGLDQAGFGVSQTSDGRLWLAWVETNYDLTFHYTQDCGEPPSTECYCNSEVVQDDSTATLRVASFDFADQSLVEVLELPIPPLQQINLFGGPPDNARLVDARAYDDQLAIGLRLRGQDPEDPEDPIPRVVRLLQVDTSGL
ncbi:hypothetical protein ACNOYE_21385 [Nannocystaceae bacterium ST9]